MDSQAWPTGNDALCYALQDAINAGRIAPEDSALAEQLVRAWVHSRANSYTARQQRLIREILKAPVGGVTRTLESTVAPFRARAH